MTLRAPRTLRTRTRFPRTALAATATMASFACALGAYACVDTDAIDFVPDALIATPPIEAGADVDADLRRPCQRCVESPDQPGPGCGNETAACLADPVCALVYQCALARGCLEKSNQHDSVTCGIPCAEEAGVRTTNDPVITLVLGVTDCIANNGCANICTGTSGSDGGT